MNQQLDCICVCGHYYLFHKYIQYWCKVQCTACLANMFVDGNYIPESFPSFHRFAKDNLTYLENKSYE